MPRTWDSLITVLSEITRRNCVALVCCHHCVLITGDVRAGRSQIQMNVLDVRLLT